MKTHVKVTNKQELEECEKEESRHQQRLIYSTKQTQKERSPAYSFYMIVLFTFETAIGYTVCKVLLHCEPLKGGGIFSFNTRYYQSC